ncbi:LysR substrate-binding domain-containing protein [Sphingopyxis macrogoltabida]|uniref:LysR family transcriptional regulator n=1 Tax=Sphingopyxis macrogoltabida TaxID=33050 RepID=A0A0N9UZ90_SPHMC|nr:LysR substrate-binding domain-containing protein [Sphingopyxis macrogoltabida]ALH81210.1 LysR family transcriptional regulator [Sphingopyxis macrogoltabida]
MTPRRFLPPTALLCAFEAAARTQSFTQAARELSLTQSAVSRQIRALEDILGAPLFHREKQKVFLTLAGSAYAREIRDALNRISGATLGFRANPGGGTLHIAALPLFGARWLMPRLPRFLAAHPDLSVNVTTRLAPFDFRFDPVDAAIHFGLPEWPGSRLDFLMNENVVPLCSPALAAQLGCTAPADLIDAPLLHLVSRPDAWERWFAAMQVDPGEVHGMLVDQFALGIEAARAGLGVALLPEFLVASELARGELVKVFDAPWQGPESYYLVRPDTHENYTPLDVFADWIIYEAGLPSN